MNEQQNEIIGYVKDGILHNAIEQIESPQKAPEKLEELSAHRARQIVEEYNRSFLISEVKSIVVDDCKEALSHRTKFDKFLEAGIIVTTVILAILFVMIPFLTPAPQEVVSHETVLIIIMMCCGAFVLTIAQFIAYLVLKFRK